MSKLRSQLDSLKRNAVPSASVANAQFSQAPQLQAAQQETRAELAQLRNSIYQLTQQMGQQSMRKAAPAYGDYSTQGTGNSTKPISPTQIANNITSDLRTHLGAEVAHIRAQLNEIVKTTNRNSDSAVMEDINRIAAGISELQNRKPVQREDLDSLIGNLNQMQGDIRSLGERPVSQVDEAAISSAIQQSYQEIASRLDGLGQDHSNGKLDALADKLEAVRGSLQDADPSVLVDIESQLKSLSSSVSAVAGQVGQSSVEVVEKVLPEYFENMDRRLNEITRAIMAAADGPSQEQQNAYERVEARLASLAKTVENMALDHAQARATSKQISDDASQASLETINSQFATLADKISSVESSINAIQSRQGEAYDQTSSSLIDAKLEEMSKTLERAVNSGDDSVNQLQVRISELSARLDEAMAIGEQVTNPPADERVLEQLQALAQRVEQLDQLAVQPAQDHAAQLQSLENQISEIANHLGAGLAPDLSGIENRLSGIEAQVQQSQQQAIEAAKEAASRLASDMGSTSIDPTTAQNMDELSKDLKSLSAASMELKGHSLETFDAVRDSLSMILDRVNGIELRLDSELEQSANPSDTHLTPSMPIASQSSDQAIQAAHEFANTLKNNGEVSPAESTGAMRAHSQLPEENPPLPQVAAPSLDLTNSSSLTTTFDSEATPQVEQSADMPLEPGSGAPDINAAVMPEAEKVQAKMAPELDGTSPKKAGLGSLLNRNDHTDGEPDNGKDYSDPTDFIAAARRAAQAAARDVKESEEHEETVKAGKPSKLAFLKQYLSNRKKPVIIAAAAILLAVVALPIAKQTLLGSSEPGIEQVAQVDQERDASSMLASDTDETSMDGPIVQEMDGDTQAVDSAMIAPGVRNVDLSQQQKPDSNMLNGQMQDDNSANIQVPTAMQPAGETMAVTNAPMPNEEVGSVALRQAAASGDPKALYEVGRRYTIGLNGKPDFAEAIKWYLLSSQNGFAPAQYHLGNFYEKGHGVSPDPQLAAQWYEKAAEGGNALAMHNLAVINAMGVLEGGSNLPKAVQWFEKAADHGVKDSQVNLGIVYTKGMGVEANLATAYKWFAIAAKAGDKDAAQKRDSIAESMRPDQITKARGEVELWKPAELVAGANNVDIPEAWKDPVVTTASLSNAQLIQKTQTMLAKIGYNPGPADGVMGAKTISAIKQFQKKVGLPEDGKVTPEFVAIVEKAL